MAATVSRIILDAQGNPQMIVHPDKDEQLSDPAFAPAGTTQYDVPRNDYLGLTGQRDLLAVVQPYVTLSGNGTLADIVQARIDLIDADDEQNASADALSSLTDRFGPNPNAVQKIDIAKLEARHAAAQTGRQAIATKLQTLLG